MPIYEYECPIHGIQEHLVSRATGEPTFCVKNVIHSWRDGSTRYLSCLKTLKKLMSSGSFRIQGVYPAMERKSDIRLRERNQALKNKEQ